MTARVVGELPEAIKEVHKDLTKWVLRAACVCVCAEQRVRPCRRAHRRSGCFSPAFSPRGLYNKFRAAPA